MEPSHWGRSFWTMMFSVALTFPENPQIDDQYHYKRFYEELQYVLPCKECKKNYINHFRELPINPYLRSGKQGVFVWVLKIHNTVCRQLKMKELSAAQAMGKYFPDMSRKEAKELCQHIEYERKPQQGGGGNGCSDQTKLLKLLLVGAVGYGLYQCYGK